MYLVRKTFIENTRKTGNLLPVHLKSQVQDKDDYTSSLFIWGMIPGSRTEVPEK